MSVALVCMPFGPPDRPSLGISILAADLRNRNIKCDVHYLNLQFHEEVDDYAPIQIYNGTSQPFELLGEYIFRDTLFEKSPNDHLEKILSNSVTKSLDINQLRKSALIAKNASHSFLDRCLDTIDWKQYSVVGFTSMFQQQVASLALAKKIKAKFPQVLIVFGGSNCHGEMGKSIIDSFPFVDAVCTGEGESEFYRVVTHRNPRSLQLKNFIWRDNKQWQVANRIAIPLRTIGTNGTKHAPELVDITNSPVPDFCDFFSEVQRRGSAYKFEPRLLFETSRGCWWGQKHHCAFCGLNTELMKFRRKEASTALQQLSTLISKYPNSASVVSFVDNIIPYDYYKEFVPNLVNIKQNKEFFYEIKVNTTSKDLQALANAGIRHLQPGMENFSNRLLKAMNKGTTRIQNLYFLRWARQLGITPYWNILTGIPHESRADYADYPNLFEKLHHFSPPPGMGRIRLDRFSPYYFHAKKYEITNIQPYVGYAYVYEHLSDEHRRGIAYFYTGDVPVQISQSELVQLLQPAIDKWQLANSHAILVAMNFGDGAIIFDTRNTPDDWHAYTVIGEEWKVLRSLSEIRTEQSVARDLEIRGLNPKNILKKWESARITISDDGRIFGLLNEWLPGFSIDITQAKAIEEIIAKQTLSDGYKIQGMMRIPPLQPKRGSEEGAESHLDRLSENMTSK